MKLKLPPWWKKAAAAAAVAGVLGFVLVGGASNVKIVRYFWQGASPWASRHVGFSTETMANVGCFVTALTMAAAALTGIDWDPGEVLELLIGAGTFAGAALKLPAAADELDLVANDNERIHAHSGATLDELRAVIDKALDAGGLVIINVDKSFTGTGAHFILCHGKANGFYLCADPATSKDTAIRVDTLSGLADWAGKQVTYDVVGVAPIYKAA